MTLYHFLGLDLNQQADCVWEGEYLASREDGSQQVLLYALKDFYAEVFFDPKKGSIIRIKGFIARSHLIPYIIPDSKRGYLRALRNKGLEN